MSSLDLLHDLRVLLVEDDDDARELLSFILARHGAVVSAASNGQEAMPFLLDRPDVVVTDLAMPYVDGFAVLRAAREVLGATPCIAVSASASSYDSRRSLDAGFDIHFAKPLDYDCLIQAISSLHSARAAGPHRPH